MALTYSIVFYYLCLLLFSIIIHFNFHVLCIDYFVSLFLASVLPASTPQLLCCHRSVQNLCFRIMQMFYLRKKHHSCVSKQDRAVLHLNVECTGWLCRTFRIERNLLHILSLSSPGPVLLGNFHNVVFKSRSHKNIQDWV